MKTILDNVVEPEVTIARNLIKSKTRRTFTMNDVRRFFKSARGQKQKQAVWEALQLAREKRILKRCKNGAYVLRGLLPGMILKTIAERKMDKVRIGRTFPRKGLRCTVRDVYEYLGIDWRHPRRR
ncbi:hypothetical protein J6590_018130 [Homalodisca vitripennis]|nr:hypothetical protein J6590_018130 [Homalodisca vitripennis]